MEYNVCRFVPHQPYHDQINILHFVLETGPYESEQMHRQAHYALCYLYKGGGRLKAAQYEYPVQAGDMFITLPAVPWSLELDEGTQYLYVSFLGGRANALMDQLGVTAAKCVYSGFSHLESLWLSGLDAYQELAGLRSEGLLLYCLSEIGRQQHQGEVEECSSMNAATLVRKYVDDHFSEPTLTLEAAGRNCGYHPKYVSSVFSKTFHMRFSDYLNTIRIQHACALMEQGIACIKDVAALCGYTDAMYFSRVFKKHMGLSPKEHCAALRQSAKMKTMTC